MYAIPARRIDGPVDKTWTESKLDSPPNGSYDHERPYNFSVERRGSCGKASGTEGDGLPPARDGEASSAPHWWRDQQLIVELQLYVRRLGSPLTTRRRMRPRLIGGAVVFDG